ncbi:MULTISPECIES: hypothetical protein [unclassified Enterococcus]|uniref:hypothetical protein n=1 Tax=unclassified Enterococcus TaxID=2608891 RepID=UPI001CE061B0|nr:MULTISPECIES: hypothetical protein [unclassified Enterococcus]MCA5014519.1 hypothetical protein [Enterococcus sp. S23]MCA5017772.1 hypothetical protein [Enterococcus sp. S22(2020)]
MIEVLGVLAVILVFSFVWNMLLCKYKQALLSIAGAVFFVDIVSFLNKSDHGSAYFILLSIVNAHLIVFFYLYLTGRLENTN